jgi:hypothetical protein
VHNGPARSLLIRRQPEPGVQLPPHPKRSHPCQSADPASLAFQHGAPLPLAGMRPPTSRLDNGVARIVNRRSVARVGAELCIREIALSGAGDRESSTGLSGCRSRDGSGIPARHRPVPAQKWTMDGNEPFPFPRPSLVLPRCSCRYSFEPSPLSARQWEIVSATGMMAALLIAPR